MKRIIATMLVISFGTITSYSQTTKKFTEKFTTNSGIYGYVELITKPATYGFASVQIQQERIIVEGINNYSGNDLSEFGITFPYQCSNCYFYASGVVIIKQNGYENYTPTKNGYPSANFSSSGSIHKNDYTSHTANFSQDVKSRHNENRSKNDYSDWEKYGLVWSVDISGVSGGDFGEITNAVKKIKAKKRNDLNTNSTPNNTYNNTNTTNNNASNTKDATKLTSEQIQASNAIYIDKQKADTKEFFDKLSGNSNTSESFITSQQIQKITRLAFGVRALTPREIENWNLGNQLGENILNSDVLGSLSTLTSIFANYQNTSYTGSDIYYGSYSKNYIKRNFTNDKPSGIWYYSKNEDFSIINQIDDYNGTYSSSKKHQYYSEYYSGLANECGDGGTFNNTKFCEKNGLNTSDHIRIYNGLHTLGEPQPSEEFYYKTENPSSISENYFEKRQLIAYLKRYPYRDNSAQISELRTFYNNGKPKQIYKKEGDFALEYFENGDIKFFSGVLDGKRVEINFFSKEQLGYNFTFDNIFYKNDIESFYANGQIVYRIKKEDLRSGVGFHVEIFKPNGDFSHKEKVILKRTDSGDKLVYNIKPGEYTQMKRYDASGNPKYSALLEVKIKKNKTIVYLNNSGYRFKYDLSESPDRLDFDFGLKPSYDLVKGL